jgi:hypothetical protein
LEIFYVLKNLDVFTGWQDATLYGRQDACRYTTSKKPHHGIPGLECFHFRPLERFNQYCGR